MTEAEKRTHRVCFTGHRPEKLTRDEVLIKKDLEFQIRQAIADELYIFISGMSRGTDIWAAQIVLKLRKDNQHIKLICACPYNGFESAWNRKWQSQYNYILSAADLVKYTCDKYNHSCFQMRNEWMVKHSAKIIAVWSGKSGGTKNTIDYATKSGVPVIYIEG